MTHITCRLSLTDKNRDQLRNPIRSVFEYGLPFYLFNSFRALFNKIASIGLYFYMKKIYLYFRFLTLEMASPGNQHCANCIGTRSFPIAHDVLEDASLV